MCLYTKNPFRILLLAAFTLVDIITNTALAQRKLTLAQQNARVEDSTVIQKIYESALTTHQSYDNLRYLTHKIGGRLSGSNQEAQAVVWIKSLLEQLGLDSVYLQAVTVPHWVRGVKEKARLITTEGKAIRLDVCALGGSVATHGKLRARVVEIKSWAELAALSEQQIKGKIVFFNRPMNPSHVEVFDSYLEAVDQRSKGAIAAAKRGAVGTLVRSLTLAKDDLPHTGAVSYEEKIKKIPAAALSTNSADKLSQALQTTPNLLVELEMNCQQLPDIQSFNVIGQINGRSYPTEILTVGAHIDSWDLAEGASDDGTGIVQTIEVMRIMKGLHSERTVRAVLYVNEENGASGGVKYAELAKLSPEKQLAAIESDAGGFTPKGFRIDASDEVAERICMWDMLFKPYQVERIRPNQRGIDIAPLKGIAKALISLDCDDQRFFDIHHTAADTFDKINRRELQLGTAAMASLCYLLSKHGL
ncbi:M28 family peptidase [Xanthocytophaga flava]|uniref:M28 family peptidase n=1 Tax=Xanthocytophaga flava TaxID=3048013 RepID=UPI0028D4FF47|nr:M28 family peptidase [Xanthocytophaga flavus]MDJ1470702.1 M28 family peptidase [Xanthocytophaga flavus]